MRLREKIHHAMITTGWCPRSWCECWLKKHMKTIVIVWYRYSYIYIYIYHKPELIQQLFHISTERSLSEGGPILYQKTAWFILKNPNPKWMMHRRTPMTLETSIYTWLFINYITWVILLLLLSISTYWVNHYFSWLIYCVMVTLGIKLTLIVPRSYITVKLITKLWLQYH